MTGACRGLALGRAGAVVRVLALTLLAGAAPGFAADIARRGEPQAGVIVAPDALPETQAAAEDLARILGQIAGKGPVGLVRRSEDATSPTRIWVGDSPGARQVFSDAPMAELRDEEIVIAVKGPDILLVGKDARHEGVTLQAGSSAAVYTFLQAHLNVRWFWPGELGEDVPTLADLSLTDRVERHRGKVAGRWLRFHSYRKLATAQDGAAALSAAEAGRRDALVDAWFRRQRGGGSFRMRAGHAFTQWHARFGKTHPEFFAVQPDGTRRPFPSPEKAKLDVTNPAVARQWLADVDESLRRAPYLTMFSASENDGSYSGYCVSPECRAWDAPAAPRVRLTWATGEREFPAMTDRYVVFWNRLAQMLREKFPDRDYLIGVWAYGALRTPPVVNRPDAKLVVGFVGGLLWDGDATDRADRALWSGWSRLVARMVWRPNLFHARWGLPGSLGTRLGETFAFLHAHGLVGIDVDTVYHDWATRGFDYYALTQLAWDPGADVRAMRADYCRRAFGVGAGAEIEKYLVALQDSDSHLVNRLEGLSRFAAVDVFVQHFSPERLAQWRATLGRARAEAARDDSAAGRRRLARVQFLEAGLEFTQAQIAVMRALATVRSRSRPLAASLVEARAAIGARDRLGEAAGTSLAIGWPQWARQMSALKMDRYLFLAGP